MSDEPINPKHFIGNPCRACTATLRCKNSKVCVACELARHHTQYNNDPEHKAKHRERVRAWQLANKDKLHGYAKTYRKRVKDREQDEQQ